MVCSVYCAGCSQSVSHLVQVMFPWCDLCVIEEVLKVCLVYCAGCSQGISHVLQHRNLQGTTAAVETG